MKTDETLTSTCANVYDVAGGRKTNNTYEATIVATEESAVLASVGQNDAVEFSSVVESVPSLEFEDDDEEEEEEEENDEWDSDEEEYDEEDIEIDEGLAERLRILADARALKNLAVAFLHPEEPVEFSDPTIFGRNYFGRFSAPEQKTDEEADEEVDILEDARALKEAAAVYLHPEVGVQSVCPECFGRNYFNRPSAPDVENKEDAVERASILADAVALKKLAVDFMHPEIGVTSTDGACFGRSYFNRPLAPETEEDEYADERAEVMHEAAALKKFAVDYMHPEVGVTVTDATVFGRNYFNRPSAPETEDVDVAAERARILAEASALKKLAVDYMHPEIGVTVTDATVYGRNYFNRPSAPEMEEDEYADERAEVLAEATTLKKLAVDYMHPEVGVTSTDGACFGRNYFNRPSAPETEDVAVAVERARILAEAAALKNLAVDYMHPEMGVTVSDGTCFGRNYFNRPSAPETEEDEYADERAEVLAEAAALKRLAVDYMHPEAGVTVTDATVFGRNYFNRHSGPETEDVELATERARVLVEAATLKKLAVDYMHPEVGVASTDGACFGRNYFNRLSAPKTEDMEMVDERARILAEAAALKRLAVDYMHPEIGVSSTDGACFGRNYFNRYSAPETEDEDLAIEEARVLVEAAALKKSAVDYMHPEVGVTTTDSTVFGRNFFNQEASTLEKLAAAVKGAKLPCTKSSSSDIALGTTKKSASSVNLFGLSEDVV